MGTTLVPTNLSSNGKTQEVGKISLGKASLRQCQDVRHKLIKAFSGWDSRGWFSYSRDLRWCNSIYNRFDLLEVIISQRHLGNESSRVVPKFPVDYAVRLERVSFPLSFLLKGCGAIACSLTHLFSKSVNSDARNRDGWDQIPQAFLSYITGLN